MSVQTNRGIPSQAPRVGAAERVQHDDHERRHGHAPVVRDPTLFGFANVVLDPVNGGNILWQHLFWFFGRAEVYIVALPFFGIISEIIPVFSRKPMFGYKGLVFATIGVTGLSMTVWAHHMFATAPLAAMVNKPGRYLRWLQFPMWTVRFLFIASPNGNTSNPGGYTPITHRAAKLGALPGTHCSPSGAACGAAASRSRSNCSASSADLSAADPAAGR